MANMYTIWRFHIHISLFMYRKSRFHMYISTIMYSIIINHIIIFIIIFFFKRNNKKKKDILIISDLQFPFFVFIFILFFLCHLFSIMCNQFYFRFSSINCCSSSLLGK